MCVSLILALEVESVLKQEKKKNPTHTLSVLDGFSYLEAFCTYLILCCLMCKHCHKCLEIPFFSCKFKKFKTLAPGAEECKDCYVSEDKLLLNRILCVCVCVCVCVCISEYHRCKLYCFMKYLHDFMGYLSTRLANPKGDIKLAG